jgi:ABC-2 type transport system permease protein
VARIFIRLKLRLYLNTLRSGPLAVVGFLVVGLGAAQFAVGGFLGLAALRWADRTPVDRVDVAVLAFSLVCAGWVVGPLATHGYDNSLDPGLLVLLPLGRRQLVRGLLAGSFVGIGPPAAVIALSGSLVGLTSGPGTVPVVALAVLLLVLFCVMAARALGATMSGLLRTRRGRDVGGVVVALLGASGYLGILFVDRLTFAAVAVLARWLRWLPPGWAAEATRSAGHGDYVAAGAWLAALASAVAILAWWWVAALGRTLTGCDTSTTAIPRPAARPSGSGSSNLRGRYLRSGYSSAGPYRPGLSRPGRLGRLVPRTPTGAVWAWAVKYAWRSPRWRLSLLGSAMISLVGPVLLIASGGRPGPSAIFLVGLTGGFMATAGFNQFGYDGPARWTQVVTGVDIGSDLRGRNLMMVTVATPLLLAVSLLLATMTGAWKLLPAALAVGYGTLGVSLGIANLVSAWCPVAVPDLRTNPLGSTDKGRAWLASAIGMAAMVLVLLLVIPVVSLALLAADRVLLQFAVVLLAPGWGAMIWTVATRRSVEHLRGREPELLAAVSLGA